MHYSRLILVVAFTLLAAALFFLPAGTRQRISGIARLCSTPGAELSALSMRVSREAIGGLPPGMTVAQRDELLAATARAKLNQQTADARLADLQAENRYLQRLLRHTKQPRNYSLVVAQVIQRPKWSNYYGNVVIDRGSSDGLQTGQAVLTLDGVVGVVSSVSLKQAVVELYDSPNFTMAAGVAQRNITALMENQDGVICLTAPMGRDFSEVRRGELVCTSDLGSTTMQPGLPVGTIAELNATPEGAPLYRVTPVAPLDNLRYLLIAIPTVR